MLLVYSVQGSKHFFLPIFILNSSIFLRRVVILWQIAKIATPCLRLSGKSGYFLVFHPTFVAVGMQEYTEPSKIPRKKLKL